MRVVYFAILLVAVFANLAMAQDMDMDMPENGHNDTMHDDPSMDDPSMDDCVGHECHNHGGDTETLEGDQFCTGATVMLNGLTYNTDVCTVFLFEDVILDNEEKFGFALLGSFLMAALHPIAASYRSALVTSTVKSEKRLGSKASSVMLRKILVSLSFATLLLNGYFLMLLVMTYQAWFLTLIIVGFLLGQIVVLFFLDTRKSIVLENDLEACCNIDDDYRTASAAVEKKGCCANNTPPSYSISDSSSNKQ
eukprot:Clim_evm6s213 gene=Clim_evmTU6s213